METYIFGLEGDIYGKNIEVQILAFDRPEQKFTSLEELKERIEKDKEFANAYYEKTSGDSCGEIRCGTMPCQIATPNLFFLTLQPHPFMLY